MKTTITSLIIAIVIISGAVMLINGSSQSNSTASGNNIIMENGVQIVEIKAKGGYQPRQSTAKAGIPTLLRFNTNGTFDCSSSIRIPSLKISRNLPPSGTTDIELGSPQASILQGTCGMGMYRFEIDFRS